MEDQLIIKLFFERSENAISELSKKYANLCKSLSYRILRNEQDVEECINDAFLAAWNSIPPCTPNPLSSYVCKIVRNLSLKRYHSNTAQKRNHDYDILLEEIGDYLIGKDTIEDDILVQELSNYINSFLSTLKEKERIIFVHRYFFCYSILEISQRLNLNPNYINVNLHRTRDKLKCYLKKEGYYNE